MIRLLFFYLLLAFPVFAQAYIGPGTGLSAIGSVLAFVGVVLLFLLGFLWYPVKRLVNKVREKKSGEVAADADDKPEKEREKESAEESDKG